MKKPCYTKKSDKNVPLFWEHIDELPVCSQNKGTLEKNYSTSSKEVFNDIIKKYQYKTHSFQLENGYFLFDDLNFKLPQRTNINTFERLSLSLGLPISSEDTIQDLDMGKDIPFRHLLHILTLLALKDLNILHSSFTMSKQLDYGRNIFEVYLRSVSGSGRIEASQKNIRWLNEQDTLQLKAKLFKTTSYQVGLNSIKYTPTNYAETIIETMFKLLKSVDFVHNNIKVKSLDFTATIDDLANIRLRDVMLLLSECIGYNKGFIIRPNLTDTQYSRVYSIFTSIGSLTRKNLGFHNYDIGAALQTICLHLVDDAALYPLHQEYVENKKDFRNKIQEETGKDEKWVKKELSKINNLDTMPQRYNNYPTLVSYYKEAQALRKEVLETAEPIILSRAMDFAKIKYKKIWLDGVKEPEFIADGKKESSIFFFIWTAWERQIRESMMSCFNSPSACHQVHDAVYSKQAIKPQIIESIVLDATGFNINIFVD